MTTTNGLNTLEYAERLIRAGVPEEQAKAQALVLYEIINSTLATKRDIADVQRDIKELDVKIETIKAELKRDIKELDTKIEGMRTGLKKDMAIIMGSYSFLILGTLVTLAKFGLLSPTP